MMRLEDGSGVAQTSDPSILKISLLSLLTIVMVFLSYSTGTVNLPS